jgi:hypothetical protein
VRALRQLAASGGKRRRAGFYSAIRREVPIRTFNDWNSPPPGFCEVDMVAHGGTSVAGSFIQTLTTPAPQHPHQWAAAIIYKSKTQTSTLAS